MDYEYYLQADHKYLYQELANELMGNLERGGDLLRELSESAKYREDYEFRTTIETARALCWKLMGEYSKVLVQVEKVGEQAKALELWNLVSINLNLAGNSYFDIGLFERALESYYRAVRNEQDHGLTGMISALYNNLAVLFVNMSDYEKGYEYELLAIEAWEHGDKNSPRYFSNRMIYLSNLVVYMCYIDRISEIPEVLDRMDRQDFSKVSPDAMSAYYIGHMYYAFHTGDRDKGKEYYEQSIRDIKRENTFWRFMLLHGYLSLHDRLHFDLSLCEEEFQQLESMQNDGNVMASVELFELLRRYYASIGDRVRYDGTTQQYIKHLEENAEMIRTRQMTSLRIVEDMLKHQENFEEVSAENTDLKLIAEEAVRHKNALQEVYQRIETINELGRNLTSSLDLSLVVELVRNNLRENIPMGSFLLVIAEPELHRLRSLVHYNGDRMEAEFMVDMADENSLFAQCYRENRILVFDDLVEERRQAGHIVQTLGEGKTIHSAIFMPMEVDGEVIGVCSIQGGGKHLYQEEHIEFLKELLPYLSIALNNAMYSFRLQKEMEIRKETQRHLEEANRKLEEANRKLEEANRKLERLSLLDGLTQIGNRRDFEHRVMKLFERSSSEKLNIGILMLDIDNFKKYNDTYGHLEGDEALKAVAKVIRRNFERVEGLSARFGGEEFIGACIGLDFKEMEELADRIRRDVFELNIEHRESSLQRLTVSVGVAFADLADSSWKSTLMRWADVCLYRAKNEGKNRVVVKRVEEREQVPNVFP